jgi:ATP-dependent RNA helicase DDX21
MVEDKPEKKKKSVKTKKNKLERTSDPENLEKKDNSKKTKKRKVESTEDLNVEKKHKLEAVVVSIKESDSSVGFSSFPISSSSITLLKAQGITELFPIQAQSFNYIFQGIDVLGRARTGTGKTLAFALPIIESFKLKKTPLIRGRLPRALVMAPTRELASQVAKVFQSLVDKSETLKITCIYGGVSYDNQIYDLKNGVDIVVGTPGRLIDLVERKDLNLRELECITLDEADQVRTLLNL